ncbi:hypothetical protein O181_021384 [Austropuccinia psidii MF-1]|uniref:Uncharacterized protein n=1 Tax=Austropuccinia psidii MF-1 TaxID=1389203 RepID=A0A9Q3CD14_9BASI|nr:hypothetical protein [Austropuccinia psidii MF-1]
MWKRACDTAAKCIAEVKQYNKQGWDKSHMEPDFKQGDKVLVSILNFKNLKGPKKMRDSFVGPFTIIKLIGKKCSGSQTHRGIFQETPSLSSEFSQAILPDKGK